MINLPQIQSLEQKVIRAVELIKRLREDHAKLQAKLKLAEDKSISLETFINTYRQEQEAIEKGILSVLSKLDRLEDETSPSGSGTKIQPTRTEETIPGDGQTGEKAGVSKKNDAPAGRKAAPAASGEREKKEELDIF